MVPKQLPLIALVRQLYNTELHDWNCPCTTLLGYQVQNIQKVVVIAVTGCDRALEKVRNVGSEPGGRIVQHVPLG